MIVKDSDQFFGGDDMVKWTMIAGQSMKLFTDEAVNANIGVKVITQRWSIRLCFLNQWFLAIGREAILTCLASKSQIINVIACSWPVYGETCIIFCCYCASVVATRGAVLKLVSTS